MADLFAAIVAALHMGFFVLERFLWNTPAGRAIFKTTPEAAASGAVLAANQGVYNLLLALGLVWTIAAGNSPAAAPVRTFILIMIVTAGFYGAATVGKTVLFVQALPAAAALALLLVQLARPRINDVTTDFDRIPAFESIAAKNPGRSYAYDPAFAAAQRAAYPGLRPLRLHAPPDAAFAAVEKAAGVLGWKIVAADKTARKLEAQEVTRFLRFTDDIVVEVRPDGTSRGCEVHARSRSRVGKSDFGANAARIRRLFALLPENPG